MSNSLVSEKKFLLDQHSINTSLNQLKHNNKLKDQKDQDPTIKRNALKYGVYFLHSKGTMT